MNSINIQRRLALWAGAVALTALTACGGGGGGGTGGACGGATPIPGTPTTFSGTVARGAPLVGATVIISAANGQTISAVTNAQGAYTTGNLVTTFPVVAVASQGGITLRSIGFGGGSVNATPLTELLTAAVLAASSTSSTPLTLSQFAAKVATDSTFAANVSSPAAVATYRTAVIAVVTNAINNNPALSAEAKAAALAGFQAATTGNFESAPFVIGDAADRALDAIGPTILSADGNVKAEVVAQAVAAGNALPTPPSGGTGAQ